VGRIIKLSLTVLLTIGGTGVALSNSPNDYAFSDIPSSGFLQPVSSNADIASASLGFNSIPDGGFGPPTATLEDSDGFDVVAEPRATLKFRDRWSFDYGTGAHPHRPKDHSQRRHHPQSLWALMGL
jgi:hypothetical protein